MMQCPKCRAADAPGTVREDGQHGRTRCGACLVATPNREWSDFEIVLSEKEAHAQAAKQLSLVGMAALTSSEITELAQLAELVSGGDQGTLTHAFGCIVAGYALKKYDQNRPLRRPCMGRSAGCARCERPARFRKIDRAIDRLEKNFRRGRSRAAPETFRKYFSEFSQDRSW